MSRDRTLGDTFTIPFSTRAFATGSTLTLSGPPVITAYEGTTLPGITAGITLSLDHDGKPGFNIITIVATGANGFVAGKNYSLVITTGNVGGVSVVGETVGEFSLELSAAFIAVGNLNDVAATEIVTAGAITTLSGAVVNVDTCDVNNDLADVKGARFNTVTDSLEAIRDRGDAAWTTGAGGSDRLLMVDTTIASLASQTEFTLSAGSTNNDAYNNLTIVIENAATATQKVVGMVLDYVGSTKTVTLKEALEFTIAATDKVYILAENSLKSTVKNEQISITSGVVDNVTLVDTTTTNTDMVGTNNALLASGYTAPDNAGITQTQVDIAALNNITANDIFAGGDVDGYSLEESLKLILSSGVGVLSGVATNTITNR